MRTFPLLCLLFFAAVSAHAADWPVREFEVVFVKRADDGSRLLPRREIIRHLSRLGNGSDSPLVATRPADNDERELAESIRANLTKAARLLEDQGFRPPRLEPVIARADGTRAYRIYLLPDLVSESGNPYAGYYARRNCAGQASDKRLIALSKESLTGSGFSLNPSEHAANFGRTDVYSGELTLDGLISVLHEFFHAIQSGSPFQGVCGAPPEGAWILEGMADSAALALAYDIVPEAVQAALTSPGHAELYHGLRTYSEPLPVPRTAGGSATQRAYRTSSFWNYLGEYDHTNGAPRVPGINRISLRYMARMLEMPPTRGGCIEPGADCRPEVVWLDTQIERSWPPNRLRDVYARFIAAYSFYGAYRPEARALWDEGWLHPSFAPDGCTRVDLSPEQDQWKVETEIQRFQALSARCWNVLPVGYGSSTIPVAITVELPADGIEPSLNQLLYIKGGTREPNAPTFDLTAGEVQRISWTDDFKVLGEGETKGDLALLTNVAEFAAQTATIAGRDGARMRITFTALEEYAALSVNGSEDGARRSDDDILDRIVRPDDIDFEGAEGQIITWADESSCRLLLQISSRHGDGLWMGGILPMPITAGSYAIGGHRHGPEPLSGSLWTSYLDAVRMESVRGMVELDVASPELISGRLKSRMFTAQHIQADVHAEFRLRPWDIYWTTRPCLVPAHARPEPVHSPAPGGPGQQPTESGPETQDETSEPEEAGMRIDGTLEFSEASGSISASPAQRVAGTETASGVTVTSPAFDLSITVPLMEVLNCIQRGGQAVSMHFATYATIEADSYKLHLGDARLALESGPEKLHLELGLEDTSVVIQAAGSEKVEFARSEDGRFSVDARRASIQVLGAELTGTCENLIEVSFQLGTR